MLIVKTPLYIISRWLSLTGLKKDIVKAINNVSADPSLSNIIKAARDY